VKYAQWTSATTSCEGRKSRTFRDGDDSPGPEDKLTTSSGFAVRGDHVVLDDRCDEAHPRYRLATQRPSRSNSRPLPPACGFRRHVCGLSLISEICNRNVRPAQSTALVYISSAMRVAQNDMAAANPVRWIGRQRSVRP